MSKISTKPPSGFRDFIGSEAEIRKQMIRTIEDCYRQFGFEAIETPALERLETLLGSSGGENEKLIFKVLKRGEKLQTVLSDQGCTEEDLADLALRFDMTVPLSRCASQYQSDIPKPWKVYHLGPVWRAERAQKGRYREFIQADVDIVGTTDIGAEVDVLLAASEVLQKLSIQNFVLKISDRRLLSSISQAAGFSADQFESFAVAVDKKDKLSSEKILDELKTINSSADLSLLAKLLDTDLSLEDCRKIDSVSTGSIAELVDRLRALTDESIKIDFDPSLARGLGYYTGSIFELRHPQEAYSFGGGGRYDELIGRFSNQSQPAVGFSLGFERLLGLYSNELLSKQRIFLPVLGEGLRPAVYKVARTLRENSICADVFPAEEKPKSQFKYARDKDFKFLLVLDANNGMTLENTETNEKRSLDPETWLEQILRLQ